MSKQTKKPRFVKVRAIDVTPHRYGVWCSIQDGEPFVNPISCRKWSDNGEGIWFMLESHNTYYALPDEEIELVKLPEPSFLKEPWFVKSMEADAKKNEGTPRAVLGKNYGLVTQKNARFVCFVII